MLVYCIYTRRFLETEHLFTKCTIVFGFFGDRLNRRDYVNRTLFIDKKVTRFTGQVCFIRVLLYINIFLLQNIYRSEKQKIANR